MKFLNTKHKRKSAVITSVLLLLLVFCILNYGLRYLDPPEEYGVVINFGDSNVGKGEPVVKTKKSVPKPTPQKEEVVEEKVEPKVQEAVKEEVITNDTSKEVIAKPKEEKKDMKKVEVVKPKKVEQKPKPKPSKATTDALNKLINSQNTIGKPQGEGDDDKQGVKGKVNGSDISKKYYGNVGSGGGNYNLAGRNAVFKPKEQPDCQEEGIVVVQIRVDRSGRVVSAIPGVKGTTNTASCLLKPAKEAALKTKWNTDTNAPAMQTGTIIYKFSLTQ